MYNLFWVKTYWEAGRMDVGDFMRVNFPSLRSHGSCLSTWETGWGVGTPADSTRGAHHPDFVDTAASPARLPGKCKLLTFPQKNVLRFVLTDERNFDLF